MVGETSVAPLAGDEAMWQAAAVPLELTVRFAETDLMGVVHHSAYIVWFEAGRVAWMEAAGVPYAEIAAGGHHFAVTGVQAEYRAAARFGHAVRVVTWLARLRSRQVAFRYEVRHAQSDELLATGVSEHICVDLEGRMAKIPQAVVERLRAGALRLADARSG
ncbi:MAG TPA: thioesterase family protein [Caldilineaceae bacterium]|nr:thioesterase family protein [Caldilineaceae bacterium]